jgi:hypothetical protein
MALGNLRGRNFLDAENADKHGKIALGMKCLNNPDANSNLGIKTLKPGINKDEWDFRAFWARIFAKATS